MFKMFILSMFCHEDFSIHTFKFYLKKKSQDCLCADKNTKHRKEGQPLHAPHTHFVKTHFHPHWLISVCWPRTPNTIRGWADSHQHNANETEGHKRASVTKTPPLRGCAKSPTSARVGTHTHTDTHTVQHSYIMSHTRDRWKCQHVKDNHKPRHSKDNVVDNKCNNFLQTIFMS